VFGSCEAVEGGGDGGRDLCGNGLVRFQERMDDMEMKAEPTTDRKSVSRMQRRLLGGGTISRQSISCTSATSAGRERGRAGQLMAIVPSKPDRSVALFVDTLEIPDEVEVEVEVEVKWERGAVVCMID